MRITRSNTGPRNLVSRAPSCSAQSTKSATQPPRSESNLRHRLSGRGIGRASSGRIALLLLHQLDEPAELLVDLPELKGGEFGRVGDAAVRALRLLVPDQRHEVRAKESIVARAYDVA